MDNVDRNKLLLEYQKLLKRLDSAERWAIDNNFNWDDVKKYKFKIWHERDNIIKEIGLITPIAVQERGNKYLLIGGEHRYIACKQ